jgi:hypothetical protein
MRSIQEQQRWRYVMGQLVAGVIRATLIPFAPNAGRHTKHPLRKPAGVLLNKLFLAARNGAESDPAHSGQLETNAGKVKQWRCKWPPPQHSNLRYQSSLPPPQA